MMHSKIQSIHLNRNAVIYIRQSSLYQVHHHQESQKRQYALKDHALKLGWPEEQIIIIDEDLGLSGAHSEGRPGYQKLISMLALRKVGIIFGIEVSRLARNCLDWYQLLELASTFNALIADEDSLFNPGDFNDRLLLGLKGTLSEAELYQIRARLMRGRLHKAQRGDLELRLPIGYERDSEGKTRKATDQGVRTAIEYIFSLFQQKRSVRGVLKALYLQKQELPYWKSVPGLGCSVDWHPASYDAIYNILYNPAYAGFYIYGKRKRHYHFETKKHMSKKVDLKDIEIVIPDHHESYISPQTYTENIQMIQSNNYTNPLNQGAPREGAALLQGIVYCKHCGLKMRSRYTSKRYHYYCCDRDYRRFGKRICGWASSRRVDAVVEAYMQQIINEGTVDLSFMMMEQYQEEQKLVCRQWQKKLQRLDYEANLGRRRYEAVDPENRLVAATLETEWNKKLVTLKQAREDYENLASKDSDVKLSCEDVKEALKSFSEKWHSAYFETREKKQILRCLIERVFINTQGKVLIITITWQGGTLTTHQVPKYLFTCTGLYHKIKDLAHRHTDGDIAMLLNQQGFLTAKGKPWTTRRVMDFRLTNTIASPFTKSVSLRLKEGYVTSSEAAQCLGVSVGIIQKWVKRDILQGVTRITKQSQLWIYLDEAIKKNLDGDGTSSYDGSLRSFRSLIKATGLTSKELVAWIKRQGHVIVRLRRGKSFSFYVQPNVSKAAVLDRSM